MAPRTLVLAGRRVGVRGCARWRCSGGRGCGTRARRRVPALSLGDGCGRARARARWRWLGAGCGCGAVKAGALAADVGAGTGARVRGTQARRRVRVQGRARWRCRGGRGLLRRACGLLRRAWVRHAGGRVPALSLGHFRLHIWVPSRGSFYILDDYPMGAVILLVPHGVWSAPEFRG
ncbi:hypothetical protein GGX14DRAFT_404358 [Mycena pura]|uniref:Uncharacterized protein n=1 Tax=Mycena pura TaxID=153505 RepID=A0AAD6Y051_9AGAR|nr:hypothetical protein GGX14DRAFT_404358 [Mycena pura]